MTAGTKITVNVDAEDKTEIKIAEVNPGYVPCGRSDYFICDHKIAFVVLSDLNCEQLYIAMMLYFHLKLGSKQCLSYFNLQLSRVKR